MRQGFFYTINMELLNAPYRVIEWGMWETWCLYILVHGLVRVWAILGVMGYWRQWRQNRAIWATGLLASLATGFGGRKPGENDCIRKIE